MIDPNNYAFDGVTFLSGRIALANPKDQWHEKAVRLANDTIGARLSRRMKFWHFDQEGFSVLL